MTELQIIVASHDMDGIRPVLTNWTPPMVASAIKNLSRTEQGIVFRVLSRRNAAAVCEFLERPGQECLLKALGKQEVAEILNGSICIPGS